MVPKGYVTGAGKIKNTNTTKECFSFDSSSSYSTVINLLRVVKNFKKEQGKCPLEGGSGKAAPFQKDQDGKIKKDKKGNALIEPWPRIANITLRITEPSDWKEEKITGAWDDGSLVPKQSLKKKVVRKKK